MAADVFVSFANDEKDVALAVKELLCRSLGDVNVFVSADYSQIVAGERWLERIGNELRAAKVVLLVLSPLSVKRPWVNFEAGAAWLKGASVIPLCFGGLTVRTLPKPYGDFQGIQLDAAGAEQLYLLVRSVSAAVGQRIPPLPTLLDTPTLTELHRAFASVAERQTALARETDTIRLSEVAREWLIQAANSATGQIEWFDMDQALVVRIAAVSYDAKLNEPQKRAAFDSALTELEKAHLVTRVGRNLFRLTAKGYAMAEVQ